MTTFTVGDGKTYSTIQAAIDAIPGDLSGQGVQTVEVYAKAAGYAETLDVLTGFSNASAADYIHIKSMVSHAGQRGGGIVLDVGSAAVAAHVQLSDYVRLSDFCITSSSYKAGSINYILHAASGYGDGVHIYNNLIYDCDAPSGYDCFGLYLGGGDMRCYNNALVNIGTSGNGWPIYIAGAATSGHESLLANNTVLDAKNIGIHNLTRNYWLIENNYVGDSGTQDYYTSLAGTGGTFLYNISSDATAGSADANLSNKASANQFVSNTPSSFDVHLKATADCNRTGIDESSYFTTDFEGAARANFNTGADECCAGPNGWDAGKFLGKDYTVIGQVLGAARSGISKIIGV